jgi:hypothetical protein
VGPQSVWPVWFRKYQRVNADRVNSAVKRLGRTREQPDSNQLCRLRIFVFLKMAVFWGVGTVLSGRY